MLFSDMNGLPESGFPVLANEGDRIVLNTLHGIPMRQLAYILDVLGNNRLLGSLLIAGDLTGVANLTASGTISATGLSLTGNILTNGNVTLSVGDLFFLGTGNISTKGNIGDILARVKKIYATDLNLINRPTVGNEDWVALVSDLQELYMLLYYDNWKVAWFNAATDGYEYFNVDSEKAFEILAGNGMAVAKPTSDGNKVSQVINAEVSLATSVRRLASFYADAPNVGTANTVVYSYTLPANSLNAVGQYLDIEVFGEAANNANSKSVYLNFDGVIMSVVTDSTTASLAKWRIKYRLIRISANEIRVSTDLTWNFTTQCDIQDRTTFDFSAANIITISLDGVASNDLIAKTATITIYP